MSGQAVGPPPWAPEYGWTSAEVEAVEFEVRVELADFRVEELPLFEPEGSGGHVFLEVEKRGISTWDALRRVARRFAVPLAEVGYAGLKDARGVTTQRMSVPCRDDAPLQVGEGEEELRVRVLGRHPRKLRLGQLAGNRFRLVLRGVAPDAEERLRRALEVLVQRGLPNFFGAQRFGLTGEGFELGRALLRGDARTYLRELVGPKQARQTPAVRTLAGFLVPPGDELARAADTEGAASDRTTLRRLAGSLSVELAPLARALARDPDDLERALAAVPKKLARMHVCSLQALVFNRVLGRRLREFAEPHRVVPGDVATFRDSNSCFLAEEEEHTLAARSRAGDIVPAGPLPGRKLLAATGRPGALEAEIFAAENTHPAAFAGLPQGLMQRGARRPFFVPVREATLTSADEGLVLTFTLPPGAYATSLVEELRKRHRPPPR